MNHRTRANNTVMGLSDCVRCFLVHIFLIAFVHTFCEAPKTSDYEHQCTKQSDIYIQIYPIIMALYTFCVVSNKVIAPVVTMRTYTPGWLVNKSTPHVKPQSLIMRKVLISVTFPINSIPIKPQLHNTVMGLSDCVDYLEVELSLFKL